MMLVRFYSLLHKFVIIFLLPEILNKLFFFCSNCWCWRRIYFLVLLPPMIGIETCGWILIICPMRYYLLSCLILPECWRGFVRGCFSFWILPYSVFEALAMIWVLTMILYEILMVHIYTHTRGACISFWTGIIGPGGENRLCKHSSFGSAVYKMPQKKHI